MKNLSLNKISLVLFILTMVWTPGLRAAQINLAPSQDAAAWLNLPTSARAAGMGDAFGAMGEDLTTFEFNPAGLVQLDVPQILLTHNNWIQGVALEHFSIGMPLDSGSGIALSFDYLNLGSVDSYFLFGNTPVPNGSFNPDGYKIGLGYGLALNGNFDAGLVVKYFQQNIDTSYGELAGDFGLMAHGLIPRMSLGLSVENIGDQLQGSSLPVEFKAALAYKTDPFQLNAFNLALDANFDLAQTEAAVINAGVEYWYDGTLALRAGDQISEGQLATGLDGLSLGAGVNLGDFELDYAFVNNGYLGNANLVSLLAKLDQQPQPQLTDEEVKILEHLNKNIQFAYDRAYLRSEFDGELARLGDILLKRPQDHVVLTGYASHEGTAEHNQELSEWRANEVRDRFLSRGVPAEQIVSRGRGEVHPVVAGSTEAELSPNRRVEIRIIQRRPGWD